MLMLATFQGFLFMSNTLCLCLCPERAGAKSQGDALGLLDKTTLALKGRKQNIAINPKYIVRQIPRDIYSRRL